MKACTRVGRDGSTWVSYARTASRRIGVPPMGRLPLVILGPPGMSLRFWLPVLSLLPGDRSVLAVDYRGLTQDATLLEANRLSFEHCIEDVAEWLDAEAVTAAHFLAWCGGANLALALSERRPALVRSLFGIAVTLQTTAQASSFVEIMSELDELLTERPASAPNMLVRMQRTGLLRDAAFFDAICPEGLRSTDAAVASLLVPSMGDFLSFNTAARLLNYLRLFKDFNQNDRSVTSLGVPVTLVNGSREGSTSSAVEGGVRHVTLPQASETLLLERPREIALELACHLELAEARHMAPTSGTEAHHDG